MILFPKCRYTSKVAIAIRTCETTSQQSTRANKQVLPRTAFPCRAAICPPPHSERHAWNGWWLLSPPTSRDAHATDGSRFRTDRNSLSGSSPWNPSMILGSRMVSPLQTLIFIPQHAPYPMSHKTSNLRKSAF